MQNDNFQKVAVDNLFNFLASNNEFILLMNRLADATCLDFNRKKDIERFFSNAGLELAYVLLEESGYDGFPVLEQEGKDYFTDKMTREVMRLALTTENLPLSEV